jgi:hypothetical protein
LRGLEKQKDGSSGKGEDTPSKDPQGPQSAPSDASRKGGQKDEKKARQEDPGSGGEEKPNGDQTSAGSGERVDQREPQDLSGKLEPRQESTDQPREGRPMGEEPQGIDRRRAEALLDNIREDPLRFRRHQSARERVRGVPSGKDW